MLSSCVLVGEVVSSPEITTTSSGNTMAYLFLKVLRPFKSEDSSPNIDTFKVLLWRGIAEECRDNCHSGSIVAIKGRLQSSNYEKEEKIYYNCDIIAEKVAYISNS